MNTFEKSIVSVHLLIVLIFGIALHNKKTTTKEKPIINKHNEKVSF